MSVKESVAFAIALEPIMKKMYKAGVIAVNGSGGVHMEEEAFRETFPEYDVYHRGGDYKEYELYTSVDGVRVFCLSNDV